MILFNGQEIILHATPGIGDKLVVTFTSFEKSGGASTGGWQGTVERLGFPGLFFISKQNHWFNSHELDTAVEIARKFRDQFKDALLTGASMGGHAALRLYSDLNASVTVAISPQYCIRNELVPFEKRWTQESIKIKKYDRKIDEKCTKMNSYIIYDDNHEQDKGHVDLISNKVECTRVPLSNSGHSSVRALADLKLLDLIFKFSGEEAENKELLERINKKYKSDAYRSAHVIIQKASKMSLEERYTFLQNLPSNLLGITPSKKALEELKSKTHGC